MNFLSWFEKKLRYDILHSAGRSLHPLYGGWPGVAIARHKHKAGVDGRDVNGVQKVDPGIKGFLYLYLSPTGIQKTNLLLRICTHRMKEQAFNRTRMAPTPSGYLHLGNVFSFALTAALARRSGAKIFLRIDDLDRARCERRYVQDIFDTLNFLEIPWDEGPRNMKEYEQEFSQGHRLDKYAEALVRLKEGGHVYACECSRAQATRSGADGLYAGTCRQKNISLDARNTSWRLRTDKAGKINVKTPKGKIREATFPAAMHDFVVRKKDGFPAYQLASVVDDVLFEVDLVVRGGDLWHSTLAQLYLSALCGLSEFTGTSFYHHALIETGGKKLSKSAGDTSVCQLRRQHKKPTEVYTLIAQMLNIGFPVKDWAGLAGAVGECEK